MNKVTQLHLYRTLTKSLAKSNKTDKHFVLLLIQMGASVCSAYYTTVNESAKMFSDSWAAFPMPNCGPFIAKNGANPSCTLPFKMFGPFGSVLCKIVPAEVGLSIPWWCNAVVLLASGYWGLFFKSHNFFIMEKCLVSE